MRKFSALALAILLFGSILIHWIPDRWPIAILQIGAFALAGLWALSFLRPGSRPVLSIVMVPLAGTFLWALAQLALHRTVYPWQTWTSVLYWAANFALFFVAVQTFSDKRIRNGFLEALLIFGFVLSLISPLQMLTGGVRVFWLFPTPFDQPLMGPFVYRNQYAAFIELLLPLALLKGFTDRERKTFYLLGAAVMYGSVIASGSRAGVVLTTLELLVVPALAFRKTTQKKNFAISGLLFAGMILILTLSAGPAYVWNRLSAGDPYAGRREYTLSALDMIRDRPLTGFGLGTWTSVYPGYASFDNGLVSNAAHDDWAQWTAEGGFPFLAFMLFIAGWSARSGFRSVWPLGAAVVFVHSFVDYPAQRAAESALLIVFISAATQECDEFVKPQPENNSD